MEKLASPLDLVLDMQVNFISIFAQDKFCVVEESSHQEIEKVSTWRGKHCLHPGRRVEKEVNAFISDELDHAVSLLTDDLYGFLEDLEVRKGESA